MTTPAATDRLGGSRRPRSLRALRVVLIVVLLDRRRERRRRRHLRTRRRPRRRSGVARGQPLRRLLLAQPDPARRGRGKPSPGGRRHRPGSQRALVRARRRGHPRDSGSSPRWRSSRSTAGCSRPSSSSACSRSPPRRARCAACAARRSPPDGSGSHERRPARSDALAAGPDGRPRCWWSLGTPEYVAYHDRRVGPPRARRRAALRAPLPRGVPVGALVADDPAQARGLPGGLRRLRRRRRGRLRPGRRRTAARRRRHRAQPGQDRGGRSTTPRACSS